MKTAITREEQKCLDVLISKAVAGKMQPKDWELMNVLTQKLQNPVKAAPVKAAPVKATAPIKMINYSEKSIAVIGDTKPIKEILKSSGGRFNAWLRVNGEVVPGWIFSAKKAEELKIALKM